MTDPVIPAHAKFSNYIAYADVGSYGLAHSLLAWARCWLWSQQNQVPMLAPSWLHIRGRIGPILRGERDSRQYHRLFTFPGYINGLRRLAVLATRSKIDAAQADLEVALDSSDRQLVVFKNLMSLNEETHFHEIIGHSAAILGALTEITKPQYRPQTFAEPHVAIHVRMGDFSAAIDVDALKRGAKNSRIPVVWYCNILNGIRKHVGNVPAVIYSDGSDDALADLLALPRVMRPAKQESIADLLGIAQARMVISSGSGFSMWGAFLGDAPRICHPGQRFFRVLGKADAIDREPECGAGSDLDVEMVLAAFAHRAPP